MSNETEIVLNKVMSSIAAIYPAWKNAISSQEQANNIKKQWLIAFMENGITTDIQINKGLAQARKDTNPFLPPVGQFIEWCKPVEIDVEAKAEIAWSEIVGKIASIGSYDNLKMNDGQALAAVKAMGGWKNLCSKTHEQLVWEKKEFTSIYSNYESTPLEMLPDSLPGRIELQKHKKYQYNETLEQVKKLARKDNDKT